MKILRIIARLNIGGPARNAVILTEGMDSSLNGWETVLVCGKLGDGEGDMGYLAKEKGIKPVMIEELGRELSFMNDWKAFCRIYGIICRERPDIVHTHTAKAGTLGRIAALLYNIKSRKKKVKIVHTFHGHVLHSYFGKVKTWVFIWIEKILALFTDSIITVGASLKRELVEKFRIAPEKKFTVVELGFELEELLKIPLRESRDAVNIGIIGRLAAVKNHKMLLRVAKELRVRRLEDGQTRQEGIVPVCYSVIGDGELREDMERYTRELGIENIVKFRGWVKDLSKIYEGLDIVVLTSLNEGTPVSIIEAMAAGRPVVATEVGGVLDIVQDGESGYLAGFNDDKCFAEKLLVLINDFEKRKRFGGYGRKLARERFTRERLIRDTERLYRNLLGA